MRRAALFIPAVAVLSSSAHAQAAKDPRAIQDVSVSYLGAAVAPTNIPKPDGGGDDSALVLDQIINIATKVWRIIEENKPVVDVKTQYAVAVPSGTTTWGQLAGWRPPKGEVYELLAKNGYGSQVVRVRYQVLRTFGGSVRGKGRYLTGVTVEPLLVEVAWKYKLTLRAEVPESSVVNAGSHEDPVAAMLVKLYWHIETPIKDSQGQGVYYVTGDGRFQEIGRPFPAARAEGIASRVRSAVESGLP